MGFYNFEKTEELLTIVSNKQKIPQLDELEITENSPDYFYISQDNFAICKLKTVKPVRLYCDSATSCIIIIAIGINQKGERSVIMSHLSRPGRFDMFFQIVNKYFNSDVEIYAAGANPPEAIPMKKKNGKLNYTALENALRVTRWVGNMHSPEEKEEGKKTVSRLSFRFGEGDPSVKKNNLDCLGIMIGSDTESVHNNISNARIELKQEERDADGVQTLFCIYGDKNYIHNAATGFSKNEIDALVAAAKADGLEKALEMDDDEILNTYSSTPDFEVEWFCDSIRQAAKYVKDHSNN